MPTPRLLSVAEAAARLGLSPSQTRNLCATGALPATRVGARSWAIPESALAKAIKRRRVGRPRRV